MRRERLLLIGAVLAAAGCNRAPGAAAVADTTGLIAAAPTPPPGDTICTHNGMWAACSVLKRLEQMGLKVHWDSVTTVSEEPLAIRGLALPIARGEIKFFLYADTMSRARDEARLDKKQFVTPEQPQPGFGGVRTVLHSANLLVLMNVLNGLNRERIANGLMAGPPQPPKKRP